MVLLRETMINALRIQLIAMFSLSLLPILSNTASADGLAYEQPRQEAAEPDYIPDSERSKRLPPLLPGQEVSHGGRKMRVWTTVGPVPVSPAPEPFKDREQVVTPGSVIVDSREQVQKHAAPETLDAQAIAADKKLGEIRRKLLEAESN